MTIEVFTSKNSHDLKFLNNIFKIYYLFICAINIHIELLKTVIVHQFFLFFGFASRVKKQYVYSDGVSKIYLKSLDDIINIIPSKQIIDL